MRAALEQEFNESWEPLAFFSQKFSTLQMKYSFYDKELTAIYEANQYFRQLIEGRDFEIATDQNPYNVSSLYKKKVNENTIY